MNSEVLVNTLEQSLRQLQTAKHRLSERLETVRYEISVREREAADLKEEIGALENSAAQTEKTLADLLKTLVRN